MYMEIHGVNCLHNVDRSLGIDFFLTFFGFVLINHFGLIKLSKYDAVDDNYCFKD